MRIENLLDTSYYENFIKRLQTFPTTDANYTFHGKDISEIANVFRLCFESKRNWMPSYDETSLTSFFEKDNNLERFHKELLAYVEIHASKREFHESLICEEELPTMNSHAFNIKASQEPIPKNFNEFMKRYRSNQNIDHIFNFIENGYKLCT